MAVALVTKTLARRPNTQIVQFNFGEQQLVFEVRGLETSNYKGANVGIIIEGTKGYLVMSSYDTGVAFDAEGNEIKKFSGGGDHHHYANFIEAVRSRDHKKLNADVEEGHLSSALCHLGNISLRLGKPVAGADVPAALKENKGHEDMVATFQRTAEHLKANSLDPDALKFSVGPMLAMDGKAEVFSGSSEANAMLSREYRAPYTLPGANEV